MITGSIGMLPSASLGASGPGLYEPIHGSAPDIAGKDLANPLATILSVAMMFTYSLGLPDAAASCGAGRGRGPGTAMAHGRHHESRRDAGWLRADGAHWRLNASGHRGSARQSVRTAVRV